MAEPYYSVKITGMPKFIVQASNPGKVRAEMRKLLKRADDIESVDRMSSAEVRAAFRDAIQTGELPEETYSPQKHEWGTAASIRWAKKITPGENVREEDEGEYDNEGEMAKNLLKSLMRDAEHMISMFDDDENLPEWVQGKIIKAQDYLSTAHSYLMSKKDGDMEESRVVSADKKIEKYRDPETGKTKIRMVPVDREIIKNEEVEQVDEAAKKIACIKCDEVSTERAWKKKGGTCPKCKKSTQGVAEEVDQIEERNKENARMRKMMDASRGARFKAQNPNMVPGREKGHKTGQQHNKAIGRALRNTKEEVEQVDELKKSTLASYIGKAAGNVAVTSRLGAEFRRDGEKVRNKERSKTLHNIGRDFLRQADKRRIGIKKAANKLAKEEVEQTSMSSVIEKYGMKRMKKEGIAPEAYADNSFGVGIPMEYDENNNLVEKDKKSKMWQIKKGY